MSEQIVVLVHVSLALTLYYFASAAARSIAGLDWPQAGQVNKDVEDHVERVQKYMGEVSK